MSPYTEVIVFGLGAVASRLLRALENDHNFISIVGADNQPRKYVKDSSSLSINKQAKKLYDIIKKEADLNGSEIIYDLYCNHYKIDCIMAKRRRRLSSNHEKDISRSIKEVELFTAKINDIREDEIRDEYLSAFSLVKLRLNSLKKAYDEIGFNEESINLLNIYKDTLNKFINEYEI